ncbi:putative Mitochondrial fission 1 protein [Hypsibius exemplaris]|uniref:Mitochondrial fission 1 protein n=1 Tax=Hypsibius exemplaris TaxID=2072580 RepID=A0A1W0W853_HYPEX|nr:putative Mitochondrial fission 1 protein [Hypsibius exemplaris]
MEAVIDDHIDPEELQLHSRRYEEELSNGQVGYNTAFDYGWCLIRSRKQEDIMKGVELFKHLYKNGETKARRDCLFFTAVGYTKIREGSWCCRNSNWLWSVLTRFSGRTAESQAKDLKRVIEDRLKKSGLMGMGLIAFGGATVVAAIGLVALLTKKK